DGLYGGTPRGDSSFSGHGAARPFGNVLFGTAFRATPSTTAAGTLNVSNGSAELITLKGGNQLRVQFTGVVTAGTAGTDPLTFQGMVASGTGRFLNAGGTFQATGSATPGASGKFALDFLITFNPPV